jgi:hypothetical protein
MISTGIFSVFSEYVFSRPLMIVYTRKASSKALAFKPQLFKKNFFNFSGMLYFKEF